MHDTVKMGRMLQMCTVVLQIGVTGVGAKCCPVSFRCSNEVCIINTEEVVSAVG